VGERNNSAVALLPVLVPTETFKPGPTMYHASNKAYYRLLFLHCGRPKQDVDALSRTIIFGYSLLLIAACVLDLA
jgi:hypothetical protein